MFIKTLIIPLRAAHRALRAADLVGALEELVHQHADDGAEGNPDELRLELLPGGGLQQVARLEVRGHVARLQEGPVT
eukprot:1932883-Pyramimonas_sp.AAC.1